MSLFLLVLGCAPKIGPASFTPTMSLPADLLYLRPPKCALLSGLTVDDPRAYPNIVGSRFREDAPSRSYAIEVTSPAADWARSGLLTMFAHTGVPLGAGGVAVNVRLKSFGIEESEAFNSDFRCDLVLDVAVATADGSPCWTGTVQSRASNYGVAGKEQNYQETANAALIDAATQLLANPAFLDATCGKCAS